jgi:hypothetical protein
MIYDSIYFTTVMLCILAIIILYEIGEYLKHKNQSKGGKG